MKNNPNDCRTCDHMEGLDEEWCFMHKVRPMKRCFYHTTEVTEDLFNKKLYKFRKETFKTIGL